MTKNFYSTYGKRLFDVSLASILTMLAIPICLIIMIIQFLLKQKPIFFRQKRVGYKEQLFQIVKFATMTNKTDCDNNLLPDDMRITKFGSFLRKTSLDEIPQIYHVLKGEMSFIGPRPLLEEYLQVYNEEQKKRHLVKPGITGLAQVNGRNNISWTRKFEYDIDYVNNISFKLDMIILFKTVKCVLQKKDINKSGFKTTDKFYGSN